MPLALPALTRALKLQEKAGKVGFDWNDPRAVLAKLREEIDEVEAELDAGDAARVAGEVGDLLFAVANLARHLDVDPEAALRGANAKFERRFAHIERGWARPDARRPTRRSTKWRRCGARPSSGKDRRRNDDLWALLRGGNAVFDAPVGPGKRSRRALPNRALGFDPPIVPRDGERGLGLVAANPFLAAGADADTLHAACLTAAPSVERVARLEPNRSPPDAFTAVGADVYPMPPNGVGRSKLSDAWLTRASASSRRCATGAL